jgi:iron complex outermembrane recepter protein
MVPGVQVARADSNSWAISIRGFNSTLANKLLVLMDGRSIYNPVFGGVLWEAHELMLEDIERIEVIRGPGGTIWGANAVNGVINIITKHSRDTQGTLASTLYGNEEQGTVSVRQGGQLRNNGTYRVYAKLFQRDASHKPGGGNTFDEWDGWHTGFRTDWGDKFTLQGDAYRTDTQQKRVDYSLTAPFMPVKEQNIRYEGAHLLGRWAETRADQAHFSLQAYIDWAKRDEPFNFVDDRTTIDLDAQYNFAALGSHEFIFGGGLRLLSDDKQGNRNVEFAPQKRSDEVYSFFVQDKIALKPDSLFVTLGSKFEHNNFSGYETQPNIRLQWQPNAQQTFWSAISRAVRTPTAIEEDLTSTLATGAGARIAFEPNNNFQPEELIAYEVGYRQQINSRLSIDLSSFYNDYQNLMTTSVQTPRVVINNIDPPHVFIPIQFTNNMQGTTRGIELASQWSATDAMTITLTYSYLDLKLDALEAAQKAAELLYPRHQAGLAIFYNLGKQWTLDTSATYVDQLVTTDSYIRWTVNLGKQLGKNLRFNLTGENLGDPQHPEFGSASDINAGEIERSIFAKLTWQF